MKRVYDLPIMGIAYPTGINEHYRCFDGQKWNDCDKYARIISFEGGPQ